MDTKTIKRAILEILNEVRGLDINIPGSGPANKKHKHNLIGKAAFGQSGEMNQLENYLSIIEDHSGDSTKTFEAYLVGKSISKDLSAKKKYRSTQFKIRTYTDLIDDVKHRYSEFYKTLK